MLTSITVKSGKFLRAQVVSSTRLRIDSARIDGDCPAQTRDEVMVVTEKRDVRVNVESMPAMHALQQEAMREIGLDQQDVSIPDLTGAQARQVGQRMIQKIADAAQSTASDREVDDPPVMK